MEKNRPLMWFEGMPVGPEVFQQQALYLEKNVQNHSLICSPFGWGIYSVEFDLTNLSEGYLKLINLRALTQNYVMFEVDESDDLKINLKDYKNEFKEDKEFFIFLSVPNNPYTEQKNESNPRYSIELKKFVDFNNKTRETEPLPVLKNNYFLELGETQSLKNESIPLAKVKFNGLSFQLSEYEFPTQRISNAKTIMRLLKDLVIKMKDKLKYLKNIKKISLEQYTQLSNISNILFPLEGMIKSDENPYNVYKLLTQGIAYSFNFSKNKDLPTIEQYNHQNIYPLFKAFIDYINSNLDSIFEAFQLNKFTKKNNTFEIELDDLTGNYLLIAIEKTINTNYEDLAKWISNIVIATEDKIELVKEQRSRGAERFKVDNYQDLDLQEMPDMLILKVTIKEAFISSNSTLYLINNNENLDNPHAIYLIQK